MSAIVLTTSSAMTLIANAAGMLTTNVDLGKNSFGSHWTLPWDFECDGEPSRMFVGYDTFFVKEDFVEDFVTDKNGDHYAGVKNSNGKIAYTDRASVGYPTGKADVEHTGSPVTYYAFW